MRFNNYHIRKALRYIPLVILGVAAAAGFALLFGFVVMLLWNWLMPSIFGLPELTYWQAWGIVLLFHILFKGNNHQHKHFEHGHSRREWKEKFRKQFMDDTWDKENETD